MKDEACRVTMWFLGKKVPVISDYLPTFEDAEEKGFHYVELLSKFMVDCVTSYIV